MRLGADGHDQRETREAVGEAGAEAATNTPERAGYDYVMRQLTMGISNEVVLRMSFARRKLLEDAETSTAARDVGRGNLPNATVDNRQL